MSEKEREREREREKDKRREVTGDSLQVTERK